MIRTNLKKTKLIKKLVGEYGNNLLLKRKFNIIKLFLLRIKFRKLIRVNKYRLKFLYNNVYRNKSFWINWVKKLKRLRKFYIKNEKGKYKLNYFLKRKEFYYKEKKKHFRFNALKLFSISFFDRPIYFRYRTKYCRYFLKRQKFRMMYGFIKVKNLKRIIKRSLKYKNALDVFLYYMESRLDVLLYRLNFTTSVRSSRQLILHGKILINGKVIRSPGYNLKKKDILTFKKEYIYLFKKIIYKNIKTNKLYKIRFPNYIEYSLNNLLFKFTNINRYDVRFLISKIKIHSFISLLNFYNKCLF